MSDKYSAEQQMVMEFNAKFGVRQRRSPSVPTAKEQSLRLDLIREELDELAVAFNDYDIVGVADSLGDLLYVVYGCADVCGIDMEPVFAEIHRSNMTKVWPDGTVHRRGDGKIVKPITYSPANLEPIIVQQVQMGGEL